MNPDDKVIVADCDLRVVALHRAAARALGHQPRLWVGDIDGRSTRATRPSAGSTFITQPDRAGPFLQVPASDSVHLLRPWRDIPQSVRDRPQFLWRLLRPDV